MNQLSRSQPLVYAKPQALRLGSGRAAYGNGCTTPGSFVVIITEPCLPTGSGAQAVCVVGNSAVGGCEQSGNGAAPYCAGDGSGAISSCTETGQSPG